MTLKGSHGGSAENCKHSTFVEGCGNTKGCGNTTK